MQTAQKRRHMIFFGQSPNLGLKGDFDGGNEVQVEDEKVVENEEVVESEDEATTSKNTRIKFLTQVSKCKTDSREYVSQEFEVDDIISVLISKDESGHTDFPRLAGRILNISQHASAHATYEIVCAYGVLGMRYYAKDLELFMATVKIHNSI